MYANIDDILPYLHQLTNKNQKILYVSSLNSCLSEELYEFGYNHITCIDPSLKVINGKKLRNSQKQIKYENY